MCLSGWPVRIMPCFIHYTWILPLCLGTIISVVDMEQAVNFNWNKSNPMFQHRGGAQLTLPIGSNLKIFCPDDNNPDEYYTIYWMPFSAVNACTWDIQRAELLVNCTQPSSALTFTQQIVLFSGVPGGKDFKVGENYYLTTLSTGTFQGLTNKYKGACEDYNMKLNITISDQIIPSTQAPPARTSSTRPPDRTTTRRRTPTTTTKRPTTTSRPTTTPPTTPPIPTRSPTPVIPDPTDISIVVPDNNNGVIVASSASTLTCTWAATLLSLCLSLLHILTYVTIPAEIQR